MEQGYPYETKAVYDYPVLCHIKDCYYKSMDRSGLVVVGFVQLLPPPGGFKCSLNLG